MGQMNVAKILTKFSKKGRNAETSESGDLASSASISKSILSASACHTFRLRSLMSDLTESDIKRLCQEAQDYQIVHGGMLKAVMPAHGELQPSAAGQTVGISLHPSPFPAKLFKEACQIQTLFQQLYIAITDDTEFVRVALQDVIDTDPLTKTLWSVFEDSRASRAEDEGLVNEISAGIFRSDYMLHAPPDGRLQLKQVEMNTISCAGAAHGQRVTSMHRYLQESGRYRNILDGQHLPNTNSTLEIPVAGNIQGACTTLQIAHTAYIQKHHEPQPEMHPKLCILMVVQPRNFNIADERPIEYGLWALDPAIPCFRIEWGAEMIDYTSVTPSGALLFDAPHLPDTYEVSVIYYRAGFEEREYIGEYTTIGLNARRRFELSNAVKCPNILTHLVGSKKVQQVLSEVGVLDRFLPPDDVQRLSQCFMQMYPLDNTELGREGKKLATNPDTAGQYVLKPSREGGGHNHYRGDITSFLKDTAHSSWAEYILMELIDPVVSKNVLSSVRGVWYGDVVAELGIWGGCVWEVKHGKSNMISNSQFGWSVRSKNPNVDEMSVVKGYGCFDSIALVDEDLASDKGQ